MYRFDSDDWAFSLGDIYKMKLEIKRYPEYFNTTPGELWLDEHRVAYTIERPWKNNHADISCIPLGTFPMSLTMSKRFNAVCPLIDVPGRSGIRMHAANVSDELEGCIAPVYQIRITERQLFGTTSAVTLEDVIRYIRIHSIRELTISKL